MATPLPRKKFALIGVLLSQKTLAEIDKARGDESRDEWCQAAFELALARQTLVRRYLARTFEHKRERDRQRILRSGKMPGGA